MSSVFTSYRGSPENFDHPDIVLIQTPGWGIINPPLCLAVLSAFLRSKNYKVLPLDLNVELFMHRSDKFRDVWSIDQSQWFWSSSGNVDAFVEENIERIRAHVRSIVASGTRIVGFSMYSSCLFAAAHYSRLIKEADPGIKIIFGGPGASRNMSGKWAIEREYIDVLAQGEGELVVLDLIERFQAGRSLEDCKGIVYKKDGKVVDNGDRDLITNLSDLPFSDFTDFDFALYRDSTTLPIMSSRGCPNKCIYCSERAFWMTYRGYSPERIVDEIQSQFRKYPFLKRVEFQDSLVNGHIKRLERFSELITERGLKLRWAGQAVIRKEMTLELFQKLKASGCECLAFGLETSSSSLMINIGKLLSKGTEIDRLVEDAHTAGVSCAYNFMFGMPGETEEDGKRSLEFLRRHKDHVGTVNPSAAFCGFTPGTPGFDHPERYGIIPSKGEDQYWETADGTNNLLVRLRRFEAFIELVDDLKVPTTYPHRQLLDRDRLIGSYHHFHRNFEKAIEHLLRWHHDNPDDIHTRRRLAHSFRELNRQDMAAQFAEPAI